MTHPWYCSCAIVGRELLASIGCGRYLIFRSACVHAPVVKKPCSCVIRVVLVSIDLTGIEYVAVPTLLVFATCREFLQKGKSMPWQSA